MSNFNSLVQYTVENISRPVKYIIYKLTEFIRVVDKFVFRQVPAGAASGYANIEKVEGNTVVWNQLLKQGKLVDMGLPSGLLWATCNIDITQDDGFAASPFQYECSFFSWGNVEGHNPVNNSFVDVYNWGGVNAQSPWYEGQPYGSTPGSTLTADIVAGDTQDAARYNLGSLFKIPTSAQFIELFDNCDFVQADGTTVIASSVTDKRVTVNGIVGIYLKSKVNGNLIFFSVSGYGFGTSWGSRGSNGVYWSASFSSARSARFLGFNPSGVYPQNIDSRYYGFPVRAVVNPNTIDTGHNSHKYYVTEDINHDLTTIFGAGNEPTTVEDFEAWMAQNIGTLPYYDYNAGELLSVKMSGMQTEDSSQQTVDTMTLDVTTITGINTATNVREAIFPNGMKQADYAGTIKDTLDLRSDTATVKVGSRAYQSGDESDPDVLTDGTTTHFPSIEGYKRLDNVTIPSSSYLITNIQPRGDIHIEMDFETTTFAAGGQLYMGGRDGYAGSGIGMGHDSYNKWMCDGLTGTRYTSSYTMLSNTRYVFRWLNGVATLLTGGISVATNTFSPTITPTTPLSINGYNVNGGVVANESIKVYAFRAWNSQGEMIANYVPVVNITTSQVGLYDFVSGAFLQPTAGTWTAGTVLLPITYTDLQDANGNPLNPRYKVEQGGTEQVLPANTSTPTTVAPTLTTTYTKDVH